MYFVITLYCCWKHTWMVISSITKGPTEGLFLSHRVPSFSIFKWCWLSHIKTPQKRGESYNQDEPTKIWKFFYIHGRNIKLENNHSSLFLSSFVFHNKCIHLHMINQKAGKEQWRQTLKEQKHSLPSMEL